MFKWLNKTGVVSDKGFTLQGMHRYFYHYIEDDHVMVVYVEPFTDEKDGYVESIETSSFSKWQPPFDTEEILSDKVSEIKKNVVDALLFMEIKPRFSDG